MTLLRRNTLLFRTNMWWFMQARRGRWSGKFMQARRGRWSGKTNTMWFGKLCGLRGDRDDGVVSLVYLELSFPGGVTVVVRI